ncbi:MAG TPA: ATP-binding protein [Egibacteraceae bacterium]|nr:ATP-binding protein [Egibacteraceae bacterium]
MSEARHALALDPASARAARAFVADVLATSPAKECTDIACLLVSELVTNALLHARSPVQLLVRVEDATVRVEVGDDAERLPVRMVEPGDAIAGRGLHIVEELAARWGAERRPSGGKAVWFELSYGGG